MELRAEEVAAAERRAERKSVAGRGDGRFARLRGEGVDVINISVFGHAAEQRGAEAGNGVPAHVGDFEPLARGGERREPQDPRRKDAHALGVALLACEAHQLHADADAQHGLCERGDHGVETPFAEFRHGR